MPIPTLTIGMVPLKMPSQAWGDLAPGSIIPHPAIGWEKLYLRSQAWGDLTNIDVLPHPAISTVPFKMPSQAWGDLLASTVNPDPIDLIGSPYSDPYIASDEVVPQAGSTGFDVDGQILVVCGDRISTREQGLAAFDPLLGTSSSQPAIGIDAAKTVLTVTIGADPPLTVYDGGPLASWGVLVSTNDQAGSERGISGVGRSYLLTPPAQLPEFTTITVGVSLVDLANNDYSGSYSFTTGAKPLILHLSVVQESDFVIRVGFDPELDVSGASGAALAALSSWRIEALAGGVAPIIESVNLISGTEVELSVGYSTDGETFTLTLDGVGIKTALGDDVLAVSQDYVAFVSHPHIVGASAVTSKSVEVEFDRDLLRNAALFNASNYEVSGANVVKVERNSPSKITLTVDALVGKVLTVRVLP